MGKRAYEQRQRRRAELLKLFPDDSGYTELEFDGKVYVKRYDKGHNIWTVAEYTKASWQRYQAWRQSQQLDQEFIERVGREA